jgi:predicted nucleotidyltransferase
MRSSSKSHKIAIGITNKVFFKALTKHPSIDKIILFGSRARQDAHDRSDIDLAIVAPKATEKEWLTIVNILETADTLLKIDGVRYDSLLKDSALKAAIDTEGIPIYVKQ